MAATRMKTAVLMMMLMMGWPTVGHAAPKASFSLPGQVAVEFPVSKDVFPPGAGVDLANAFCLMCHSADMVEKQPPLTRTEWTAEIAKMQHAYGAPVPDAQVAVLAAYFTALNGRDEPPAPEPKRGS